MLRTETSFFIIFPPPSIPSLVPSYPIIYLCFHCLKLNFLKNIYYKNFNLQRNREKNIINPIFDLPISKINKILPLHFENEQFYFLYFVHFLLGHFNKNPRCHIISLPNSLIYTDFFLNITIKPTSHLTKLKVFLLQISSKS